MNELEIPHFTALTNLACASQGAKVLFATDEWFAPAKMFLELDAPVFKDGLFTDFGKWMDGWESRRRRTAGHDWCIVKLGTPGVLRGFEADTAFFTGNNVPAISVEACDCPDLAIPEGVTGTSGEMGTCASPEDIAKVDKALREQTHWREVLPKSPLGPGYEATRYNYFHCEDDRVVTHLRVNYFPDGGVARFRAYGEVRRDWDSQAANTQDELVDFAASWNGGAALAWSNAHYGVPRNCIAPGRARKMDEGWETARNPRRPAILEPGADGLVNFDYAKDWFIVKLGARCEVHEIEVDTNHFKGNFPESCLIEGIDDPVLAVRPVLAQMAYVETLAGHMDWRTVLPRTRCRAHEQRVFRLSDGEIEGSCGPVTHLRVTIFPDGGVSRLRVCGKLCPASTSEPAGLAPTLRAKL